MDGALPDWVGSSVADPRAREEWRRLVARLMADADCGWVFHGTAGPRLDCIAEIGVTTTEVLLRSRGRQSWTDGTYWGTALIAAYYAEDTLEHRENGVGLPGIVAVRRGDLARCGPLVADEQSLDAPIHCALAGEDADVVARLAGLGRRVSWRHSWDVVGSFVCRAPVPAEMVAVIRSTEDWERTMGHDAENGPTGPDGSLSCFGI